MKNKKKLIIRIIFVVLILLIILFLWINKNLKIKNSNTPENFYTCSYNVTDGYKTSVYRYEIETDNFAVIKSVKDKIILDYTEESLYQESKIFFENDKNKIEYEFNDKDKDIVLYNFIDENSYKDKSYFKYIKDIDSKYKCDTFELEEIEYQCIKSDETNDYIAKEILNILSDKNMNIKSINKKAVLEYKNKSLYLESKKNYQNIYNKKHNDKDYSVSYDYNLPIKDENGDYVEINIKNYVDGIDKEYTCKLK